MDRVAVFLDGGYLNKVLEHLGRPRLDYDRFIQSIKGELPLLRAYYYYCMPYLSPEPTELERRMWQSKQSFIHILARLPRIELRQGRLAKRGDEYEQKRTDIMLAVDMVRLSTGRQISEAVLVAGDSDFVPAIAHCKDSGVAVSLYYAPGTVSDELLDVCDELHPFGQDLVNGCLRS